MITPSNAVSHLCSINTYFSVFVYRCLQRFNAEDYGQGLHRSEGMVESIYVCGVPEWSVVICREHGKTSIRLNSERIAEMEIRGRVGI
jgi:hypothetical protein